MAEVKMPESLEERFPGNSNKDKRDREAVRETRNDIQPIVKSGRAAVAKKPLGKRILDSLFNNDDAKSVADYILNGVLIPAAKDMIFDAVTGGLSMRMYGDRGGYSPRRGLATRTNYNKVSVQTRPSADAPRKAPRPYRSEREKIYNTDITLPTRGEAYEVLDRLRAYIEQTGYAKVSELYRLVDLPSDYMDESIGWTDLSTARIRQVNEYLFRLELPPAEYLSDLPF